MTTIPYIIQRYIIKLIWQDSYNGIEWKLSLAIVSKDWFKITSSLFTVIYRTSLANSSGYGRLPYNNFKEEEWDIFKIHMENPYCVLKKITSIEKADQFIILEQLDVKNNLYETEKCPLSKDVCLFFRNIFDNLEHITITDEYWAMFEVLKDHDKLKSLSLCNYSNDPSILYHLAPQLEYLSLIISEQFELDFSLLNEISNMDVTLGVYHDGSLDGAHNIKCLKLRKLPSHNYQSFLNFIRGNKSLQTLKLMGRIESIDFIQSLHSSLPENIVYLSIIAPKMDGPLSLNINDILIGKNLKSFTLKGYSYHYHYSLFHQLNIRRLQVTSLTIILARDFRDECLLFNQETTSIFSNYLEHSSTLKYLKLLGGPIYNELDPLCKSISMNRSIRTFIWRPFIWGGYQQDHPNVIRSKVIEYYDKLFEYLDNPVSTNQIERIKFYTWFAMGPAIENIEVKSRTFQLLKRDDVWCHLYYCKIFKN